MAEVFAYEEGRVIKLDRPEWNGVAAYEAEMIDRLARAGLPVARSYGVATVDGRTGVVMDRVDGHPLQEDLVTADPDAVVRLAAQFTALQGRLTTTTVDGLPDLVGRLHTELGQSGLPVDLVGDLVTLLTHLDDGRRGACHFDFHPLNVLVASDGWVVIDWLGVAAGPPLADVARTLVLTSRNHTPPIPEFVREVRSRSLSILGATESECDQWIRVVAGARLAEGFGGEEVVRLRQLAAGETLIQGDVSR
jgi:aminoglycoside phosphotransferase (APT) family kinase protein